MMPRQEFSHFLAASSQLSQQAVFSCIHKITQAEAKTRMGYKKRIYKTATCSEANSASHSSLATQQVRREHGLDPETEWLVVGIFSEPLQHRSML